MAGLGPQHESDSVAARNGSIVGVEHNLDFVASVTQRLSENLRDVPGLEDASAQDYYSVLAELLGRRFTPDEVAGLGDNSQQLLRAACHRYFEIETLPNEQLRAAVG